MSFTHAQLEQFQDFASQAIEQGSTESLIQLATRWEEIEKMRQALNEINSMHEAAAGCGYSRDEIAAQYEDRLKRLQSIPETQG